MTLSEMKQWKMESIAQALELLEPEIMVQHAGYVTYGNN